MNAPPEATRPERPEWQGDGASRIPHWVYRDENVFGEEMARLYLSRHWLYLGLEAQVPGPGDYELVEMADRSIILVRDGDGQVHAVENACAHKGAPLCKSAAGNVKEFSCPYHQWTYNLKGDLVGLPFRRGVRVDGHLKGGMPASFQLGEHGLKKLRVATLHGLVFGSFDPDVEPLEDYLGEAVTGHIARIFKGRKLSIYGSTRQRIPANWKLMLENLKDPYHAGILHSWLVSTGLFRNDNKSETVLDPAMRHSVMASRRAEQPVSQQIRELNAFKNEFTLEDPTLLGIVPEDWWGQHTVAITAVFPNLIIQQQSNSLAMRRINPINAQAFDLTHTFFGFEGDSEEMTQRRLTLANLFGPAGYVWVEDGEILEGCERNFHTGGDRYAVVEQGGTLPGTADHGATEGLIRGMYAYWRKEMGL